MRRSETWYEAAHYPYYFRVDFGELRLEMRLFITKVLLIVLKKGQLKKADNNVNPFNFILGGMYHLPLAEALATFNKQGHDLSKGHRATSRDGRDAIVIGANAGDSLSKQLWVNGSLRLIEKYYDLKVNPQLDQALYQPAQFGKWHWHKN